MESTGKMDPADSSGGDYRDRLDTPAIHCDPGPEGGEAGDKKKKPALVIKEDYIQESGGAQKPK